MNPLSRTLTFGFRRKVTSFSRSEIGEGTFRSCSTAIRLPCFIFRFLKRPQVEIDLIVCCNDQQMLREQVQELHTREIYYRQLFETAKDGVAVLDANSGTILDVNPYLASIMGRSRLELRQTKFWDLSDASSTVHLQRYFVQLQQTNVIRFDDVSLMNGDGRSIAVDVIANTFDDGRGKKVQCNIRTKRQQWAPETLS